MNKNRYRIVYNKARNLMMAVAENTTSQGKGQQSGSGQPHAPAMQRGAKVIELFQLRPLAFAALCLFGLQPLLLQAEVIADKNAAANNRPLIDTTANGLPLVQITTPSAAGVSRNQYSQFNVDPSGVILNNSQGNVLTQQGGYVGGNPYLANGSARIILNEVTGTGASSLRGYTEVAGQRAEVVIANPNGIVCDGCGFINTSRGILTTGVPMMGSGGSLDSFRVTGGQIQIGAGGLNASNTDQLDLITRSLKVNGEIWANNLNAVVGSNQVDYTTLGVQVIAGDANKPTVGIDVALLGGMYANKIRLVGTEAGVGVNSLGTIAAQAGDFTLDNRGNVTLSGHTSSSANLAITTQGDLANTGTLEGNTVNTISNGFNNTGAIQADTLTLTATSLSNQGADAKIIAVTLASVNVTGDINNAATLAGGALSASSQVFNNTGAVQADVLTLHATSLSNLGADAKITANTSANLTVTGDICNEATLSGGTLSTSSSAFKNTGNVLAGVLAIDASSLKNLGSQAKIVGNNSVNLTVAGDINNEGTLAGATFTATSNAFNNSGSVLANELTLKAGSLNNQGATSTIVGNTSVDLNVSGNIDNAGTITAGTLTSTSNAFTNTGIVFGDVVTLNASSLNNQGTTSLIAGNTSLDLSITGDINNVGTLDGNTVATHSQTFNNTGGVFGDVVTVNAINLNNTGEPAIIAATYALNLYISDTLNNTGGANLYSMGELNAGASSTRDADGYLLDNMKVFNNVSSTVQAEGNISVSADQIINKRTNVQVDSTTVPGQNVKTVMSDKHEVLSTIDNVINPDGTVTIGSITTADTHTVAQVQGVSEVLSKTSETRTVTVQPYPDLNPDSYDYYTNLSAYNNIVTPTYSESSSCQPCYSHTFTTESVNATTKPQSNLLAGGSLHFKGAINNEYSAIAAGQNITFNANGPHTFTSGEYITPDPLLSGAVLVSANGYTQLSHVVVKTEIQDGKQDNWYSTVAEHCGYNPFHYCNYDVTWHNDQLDYKPAPITTPLDFTSLSASFTAGKNITGSATIVNNLTTNAADVSTTLGALQSSTTTALQTSITPPLNITLPKNGLFKYNTAPGQAYLIETNPRFASYREFISSDYMLSRLTLDPQQTQKRLGDGFYEQKLVSDQITNLTGRRFLSEIISAEEEFKLLMEQGIAEAHTQNLIPGVTLTTAQVAALTHDIVWMVAQEVSLPDGKKEKLLVPQVFLTRLQANDLRPNGSLIAADNIDIKVSGTLQNSGTILGSKNTSLSATDVVNQSGTISSVGNTVIVASNDIKNLSGTIRGHRLGILAGHDIVNDTEMEALQLGNVLSTRIHNTASIAATESIEMHAGHDVTVTAAKVVSGGSAILSAGNNLTINSRTATETAGLAQNANNPATNPDGTPNLLTALRIFSQGESGASGGISTQTNLFSQIQTGTDLTLRAHNDIKLTAAQIYAQENLTIAAQNITLNAVKDVKQFSFNDHHNLNTSSYDDKVIGSTLQAGGNVTLAATSLQKNSSGEHNNDGNSGDNINAVHTGGNGTISLEGASISSKNGNLSLIADADIKIGTVDEKHESFTETHSSSSDVFTSTERTTRNQSWRTDAIGSNLSGSNVSITSGHDINIAGSDIAANKDITLAAMNDINIAAATNTYGSENYSHEQTNGWQITSDLNITNKGPEITRKAREDGSKQSYSRSSLTSNGGNTNIMAGGNLIASGTDLAARTGDLALTAGGSVALLAGQDTLATESSTVTITHPNLIAEQRHTITDSYNSLDYQGSTAQANKITVSSGADIVLQAAGITAGEGGISLDAGRDIKLLAAVNASSSNHTDKLETDGVLFSGTQVSALSDRRKDNKVTNQNQTAEVTQLVSAGDITTHSAHDTLIEASRLNAQGAIDLSAGNAAIYNLDGSLQTPGTVGKITLAAVKDTDYLSIENKGSSTVWQSQGGNGHYNETIKLANISAGKGLSVNASGGIVVELPKVSAVTPAATPQFDEAGKPLQPPPPPTDEEQAAQRQAALDQHIHTLASQPGQE
jgi:filamentous hemagglutinin